MQELTKWEKFQKRMQKTGDGKVTVLTVTLILDRSGNLECWTEPKFSKLEGAPSSLGALVTMLKGD